MLLVQESMVRDRDKISMLTQELESFKSIGQVRRNSLLLTILFMFLFLQSVN